MKLKGIKEKMYRLDIIFIFLNICWCFCM